MQVMKAPKSFIGPMIITFYASAIAVQLLVILKIIPFNWVNGGMSKSYEVQAVQSSISLVALAGLFVFVSKMVKRGASSRKLTILYVITLFLLVGLTMQLLGTTFERYCLSLLLLLGVISHGLLIRHIRSNTSS
jgi:hypothetical protein